MDFGKIETKENETLWKFCCQKKLIHFRKITEYFRQQRSSKHINFTAFNGSQLAKMKKSIDVLSLP